MSLEYDDGYFRSYNYERHPPTKYSMYWWARRYYAALFTKYCPGGKLLELGCGLGHLLGRLEGQFETYGLDVSPRFAELARQNSPHSRITVGDAEDLSSFEDAFFDGIIALHLVEHVRNPESVFRECARVVRAGGTFMFATPNLSCVMRDRKGQEWQGIKDKTHISLKSPKEWTHMTQRNGFLVVKMFGDGLWDSPYWPVVPAFVQRVLFGLPAAVQVLTVGSFMPVRWGENLVAITTKTGA